jgi:uncharacterized cofD-like protein
VTVVGLAQQRDVPGPWEGPGDGSRAVALGGGHGLSRSLRALTRVVDHVTAVVTVADDGGSSGRLRRDLGVLPPGDLRMAMAALCPDEDLATVLQYRFAAGELAGHSLGNLILVAAQDLTGDVVTGLDEVMRLLDLRGRVLPCTTADVTLSASAGGDRVDGQVSVASTSRVDRVWLEPADVPATPEALLAIRRADLVVLGPGSLYTSILPNLLVPDVAAAVAASLAPVVLVSNLREQPGETEGLDLPDHLAALATHVPDVRVTHLVVHDGPDPAGPGRRLKADPVALRDHVDEVVSADLLDGHDGHDPASLAAVLDGILRPATTA